MRIAVKRTYLTIFGASLLMLALPVLARQERKNPDPRLLESATAKEEVVCDQKAISCGQTITGDLSTSDCHLEDGSYVDFWKFQGTSGQNVTMTLRSTDFDAYMFLTDPNPIAVVEDDDGAGGTDSRIAYTLNRTGEWTIGANSLLPNQVGSYALTLVCEGSGTTGLPLTSEHFPDFRFQVRIFNASAPEPLEGRKESSCLPETLCVSGAIPGRSEVLLRIVGPRPNGFMWPTIVRLTSSKVEVQIEQVSTGIIKTYVLDAASPEADELDGLQDRTGFQP